MEIIGYVGLSSFIIGFILGSILIYFTYMKNEEKIDDLLNRCIPMLWLELESKSKNISEYENCIS